jgi:hypothetical protein
MCALGANQSAIKRGRRLPYCLLLIALLLGAAVLQKDGGAGFPTAKTRSNSHGAQIYAALPLSFEANRGQTDPSVNFLSQGRGFTLFLTGREAVLALKSPSSAPKGQKPPSSGSAIRLQLLGANPHAIVTGRDELPGKANYFIGNDPSKWRTNVPTYAKVGYQSVYPGVDLVYYGTQRGELEYDFVVAAGADPKAIALEIDTQGHLPPQINSQGDLIVHLQSGDVHLNKPVVYQTGNGVASSSSDSSLMAHHTTKVEGHYALDGQNHVHFELGPYDHNRPLVIDPVLLYATYLGGSGDDIGYAIAVDANFDAYIAGTTTSTNFPSFGSPYQSSAKGNGDCFVTKIDAAGSALIYSTYIGGSEADVATAIAVSSGNVFITGYTNSVDYPTKAPPSITITTIPFQQIYGGNTDAFVTQLNATGQALVYSSYLGGSGLDSGQGIAVDSAGNAYVTGSTQSPNFPVTAGALQSTLNGSQNVFITKVNFTGEALTYSTYLGGSQADVAQSIQLDSSADMYIAGYTFSSDFPTASPLQPHIGGGADAFVTELNAAGSALTFSTFLGGSGDDRAYGLALDGSNNIYVTGTTVSSNFPTTTGVFQPELKGTSNAFISKLNPAGSSLLYSTYLGGSGVDQANAIAVNAAGAAYITGFTESSDFPTQYPVQGILGLSNNNLCGSAPCADAFITQLNPAGNGLTYSTYLGGNGPDFGQSIAVDSSGDPYITGSTSSVNFPAIWGSYQTALTSTAGNAFVAKIDAANNSSISIVPSTLNFGNETINVTSPFQQVTIVNPSTAPLDIQSIVVEPVGPSVTVFTETDNCVSTPGGSGILNPGGGYCTMYVSFTPNSTTSETSKITITDNSGAVPGTEQTISLTGTGVTAATAATVQPSSLSFVSQSVGTVSAPQTVTITNTGTETLSISGISIGSSLDFSVTSSQGSNSCTALANTLAVSQSCSVYVYFSPTASGTRTGTLSFSDNATGSPQTVALTGIGGSAFTITSPSSGNPVKIGSTQTIFNLQAQGPTSFTGAISLACPSNLTCSFSTNPIFIGNNTVLNVSQLTSSMPNPYNFTVTGTSGTQTYTTNLSIEFADYTLTVTPSSDVVQAGSAAQYTILVNPLYSFNYAVQLECYTGKPPDSSCNFPNGAIGTYQVTPNGTSPASVQLSIQTARYVPPTTHVPPRFPNGKLPPLIFGLLSLAALASLAFGNRRRARHGWLGLGWLGVRVAALSLILALDLALVACRASTLDITGTTTGDYVIQIQGELVSNTSVNRYATMDLNVTNAGQVTTTP